MPDRTNMNKYWILALVAVLASRPAAAQSRHDIVRGRVTTDSGRALAAAAVLVTRAPDRATKTTVTDTDGRYAVDWPDGTGDYLVRISAPGLPAFAKRVTRAGSDTVLVVDALLTNQRVTRLAPVVTQAQRSAPDRNQAAGADIGAADATPGPYRRIAPDVAGDLNAISLMVPGVVPTGNGISVLGLGSGQNSVTLNGMAFNGGQIPRDVSTRVRVSTSSYDPAIGWFSGARTNVQLAPAELFTSVTTHFLVDAPQLQATDPVSARLGQRLTTYNASIGGTGQLLGDNWGYNYGLQAGRVSAPVASLVTADPSLLQHAGVAADSAARFLQLLQSAGVPASVGAPTSTTTDNVVFLGRLDHAFYDWQALKPAKSSWGLTGYVDYTRNDAQNIIPTGTPAHAGRSTNTIGALEGEYARYFASDYLADVRSRVSLTRAVTDPYLLLPDGRTLVSSTFADGAGGITTLAFGGNSGLQRDQRSWTWESVSELQFYPPGKATHRVKLTADSRLDGFNRDLFGNQLGTFSFNSLSDLAANRPAAFSRTLDAPTQTGGEWNGFVSLGDLWRVNPSLQVMYGLRVEGNRFTAAPAFNPAVASAFGERTDHAPSSVSASPRLGFTWTLPARAGMRPGFIRGGIGEFRNLLPPELLANASVTTALPGGLTRLSCIGTAAPTPDWAAYASNPANVPTTCVGGAPSSFADGSPDVQLYDRAYAPQRSWRSNLSYQSSWNRNVYTVEGIYSINLSQPGTVDLNLRNAPRFTVTGEGRPVYVNPTSVVPTTGLVSPVDARLNPSFNQVVDAVSDLRSYSRQLLFGVRPNLGPFTFIHDPSLTYVLSDVRAQERGFDGSTFADPTVRTWGRGTLSPRHQWTAQAVVWPMGSRPGPGIFFYGHLQSGIPFTPLVNADVNGDGLANDRAFVFDPSSADPTLAAATRALIASSPKAVRDCLTRQFGQPAARNSCDGPWTATLNTNIVIPGELLSEKWGQRLAIGLNLTNPLSGLDQLLHGSNRLRGWGAPAAQDPVLYTVRGFDPVSQRFQYVVNPRFGSTSPSLNTLRAPFRLTLDINIDVGRSFSEQQVDRWLMPGRAGRPGARLTDTQLMQRFQRTMPDPYAELLAQTDSLLLTQEQVAALQQVETDYRAQIDALWSALSRQLAGLPDNFDVGSATALVEAAVDDAEELTRVGVHQHFERILTPVQLTLLSGWGRNFYQANRKIPVHMFIR